MISVTPWITSSSAGASEVDHTPCRGDRTGPLLDIVTHQPDLLLLPDIFACFSRNVSFRDRLTSLLMLSPGGWEQNTAASGFVTDRIGVMTVGPFLGACEGVAAASRSRRSFPRERFRSSTATSPALHASDAQETGRQPSRERLR